MPDPEDHESASAKGGDEHEKAPVADEAIDGDLLETSWDDDDEDDAAFARAFGGKEAGLPGSRTVWVVGAAVLVVVVLVGALILGGKSSKKSTANPPATSADSGGATVTTAKKKSHPSERWPSTVFGRPAEFGKVGDGVDKAKPGIKPGVYVWDDFDGWHLWVVRGAGTDKVKGSISSSENVTKAVALGAPASTVGKSGKIATFDFTSTSAPVVGINLNPGFYSSALIFVVNGPNGPIDSKLLFQGQAAAQVPNSPFAIQMTKA